MAEPYETTKPVPQIEANSLEATGWLVPPGWYGFIQAAAVGIIHRARLDYTDETRTALASLGQPELLSRSQDFEGRRLVRVDGGFIALNFIKFRDKDATTADRSRRWRERQKQKQATRVLDTPTRVIRHQAEAEAEAEAEERSTKQIGVVVTPVIIEKQEQAKDLLSSADADFATFCQAYPVSRRITGKKGRSAFKSATTGRNGTHLAGMLEALEQQKRSEQWQTPKLIPLMTTWLNQERWNQTLPESTRGLTMQQISKRAVPGWLCSHCHEERPAKLTECHCGEKRHV